MKIRKNQTSEKSNMRKAHITTPEEKSVCSILEQAVAYFATTAARWLLALDKSPKYVIIKDRMVSAENTLTLDKEPSASIRPDDEGYSHPVPAHIHAQSAVSSQKGQELFHNESLLSKGVLNTPTILASIVTEREGIISQRVSALFHPALDKSIKSATIKGRMVSARDTLTVDKDPSALLHSHNEGYSYLILTPVRAQGAVLSQKRQKSFHKKGSFLRGVSDLFLLLVSRKRRERESTRATWRCAKWKRVLKSLDIAECRHLKRHFSPGFAFLLTILSICAFAAIITPAPVAVHAQTIPEDTFVPVGLDSAGGNYRLDTVMDIVGGTSTGAVNNLIHGFYFADEASPGAAIVNIRGVPEKRVPNLNNNQTYFLIEILPAGTPYSASQVLWSSATISAALRRTSATGDWYGQYQVSLPLGNYDFYFTGLSDLKKRLPSYPLTDATQLLFTASQSAVLTLPATASGAALLSGDAAILTDLDGSCGSSTVNCLTYSGDEWGDNYINGLDLSAIVNRLFLVDASSAAILKEDLNMDGIVNGLDLSISFNNLFKYGDN